MVKKALHSRLGVLTSELYRRVDESQLFLVASSLSYTTILSIVPFLAVSFSIFQAYGGMQRLYESLEPVILSHLAQGTSEDVIRALHDFVANAHATAVGLGGMLGLVGTSMSLLYNAEKAIHQIWQVPLKKGFFWRIAVYWLFITIGPLGLSVAVGVATSAVDSPISHWIPSGVGLFGIAVGVFFGIYKCVPKIPVKAKYALVSAFVAASFANIAQQGFTFYTHRIVRYDSIYGSLGALPVVLLWIYILWCITLGGVALTATLQQHGET